MSKTKELTVAKGQIEAIRFGMNMVADKCVGGSYQVIAMGILKMLNESGARPSAIEQTSIALIERKDCQDADRAAQALADVLGIELPHLNSGGEPEPFGYFRCNSFGWEDCREDDEGAIALHEHPPINQVIDLNRPSAIELQDAEIGMPEPVTELINPPLASSSQ